MTTAVGIGVNMQRRHNKFARGKSMKRNFKMRYDDEGDLNSRSYRLKRRQRLTGCSYCPPHGGENRRRQERPTKYKDKRKGRL